LRAPAQTQQAWVYHVPGGFNEQALSNVVYAYEKAGMLDRELLQWVFSVAALRLDRRDAPPSFKPQVGLGGLQRGRVCVPCMGGRRGEQALVCQLATARCRDRHDT
jgi:hypothetical protein